MPAAPARPVLLLVGQSVRALAQSAHACGLDALSLDLFGDEDTRAASLDSRVAPALDELSLLPALRSLSRGRAPAGLVAGTGFEDRPGLLDRLARCWTLLGNDGHRVRACKDPFGFAALCRALDVPHPPVRALAPGEAPPPGWLRKRQGGAGGTHVGPGAALPDDPSGAPCYAQARVPGRAIGVLFLADGERAVVLGHSAQWCDPALGQPFRFGGAVRLGPATPDGLPDPVPHRAALAACVSRLAASLGLVGLNSADILHAGRSWHLLEINPRPGATLDLHRGEPLLRLHIEACRGWLPAIPRPAGRRASWSAMGHASGHEPEQASGPPAVDGDPRMTAVALAHAREPLRVPPGFAWPAWTADRQRPGPVAAGAPVCSVLAAADTSAAARALARRRARGLLRRLAACPGASLPDAPSGAVPPDAAPSGSASPKVASPGAATSGVAVPGSAMPRAEMPGAEMPGAARAGDALPAHVPADPVPGHPARSPATGIGPAEAPPDGSTSAHSREGAPWAA